jgi:hypothetical protein
MATPGVINYGEFESEVIVRIFEGSLEIEDTYATHKHTNKDIQKHTQSRSKEKKGSRFLWF